MIMIDYHVHTYLCRHAEGDPQDYVNAAVEKGLKEIGIADHFPLETMGITPKMCIRDSIKPHQKEKDWMGCSPQKEFYKR